MIGSRSLSAPVEPRRVALDAGRHAQTAALAALWLLLTCAAGFRWLGDSRDYLDYLAYYNQIPPYLAFNNSRFEAGFHFCAWFARTHLNMEYDYFVLIVAGLSLAIKFHLFKKYLRYPLLAAVTYVAIFYPMHEYTQIRVGLALALGYLTIHCLYDRRWMAAALWFVLAYLFHTSVIVLPLGFLAARYVRGNMAVILIGIGAAVLFYISEQLRELLVQLFSSINPLLRSYVDNRTFESVSLLSINNLLLIAAMAAAVVMGWFKFSRYHALFLTLSLASIVAIAVLASSPIVANRTKEVLFVSVIFLIFRSKITLRTLPTILFIWADSVLLFYLAFREGLISL
ncbi:MAG: hypothetical protein QOD42_3680 [Sphingomonadales bacterium]|jgi:hypothetical protein|nr:hypothetical protein [Sphingomonadales bacterium]